MTIVIKKRDSSITIKTPDAIAATATFLKIPLVTGDKKVSQVENIITVLFTPENY